MPVVLFRVDDRLIHGQVTVAWGARLSPDLIVLANDEVASSPWKRDIYSSGDTMGTRVAVLSVDELTLAAAAGEFERERVLIVVESPCDLLRAVEGGMPVEEANIGGMHRAEGKREVLPYVYVDDRDVRVLRTLAARGVRLEARDVPQARPVDLVAELARTEDARDGGGAE